MRKPNHPYSNIKMIFVHRGRGLISEVKIPVHEHGGQRGEGAYFQYCNYKSCITTDLYAMQIMHFEMHWPDSARTYEIAINDKLYIPFLFQSKWK